MLKTYDEEIVQAKLKEHGFALMDTIGEGAFARVYQVQWHQYPEELFCAKVIKLGTNEGTAFYESYNNEINALTSLFHSNIIKIYKHFTDNDYLFMIFEYCTDGNIQERVNKSGPIPINEFNQYAIQCLEALNACHKVSIAHRDIKPSNILIDKFNRVKLADFGLAELILNCSISKYNGSVPFMAPEIFQKVPYDPQKSDIWALGVSFYFMLVGRVPWNKSSSSLMINDIQFNNPTFPENSFPKKAKVMILAMLKKSPQSRPSAEEILKSDAFTTINNTRSFSDIKRPVRFTGLLPSRKLQVPNKKLSKTKITAVSTFSSLPPNYSHVET